MATLQAPAGAADPPRQKINKHSGCPRHPAHSLLLMQGLTGTFPRQNASSEFVGGGTGKPRGPGRPSRGMGSPICHLSAERCKTSYLTSLFSVHSSVSWGRGEARRGAACQALGVITGPRKGLNRQKFLPSPSYITTVPVLLPATRLGCGGRRRKGWVGSPIYHSTRPGGSRLPWPEGSQVCGLARPGRVTWGKGAPKACIVDGTLTPCEFFGKALRFLGLSFLTSKTSMSTNVLGCREAW